MAMSTVIRGRVSEDQACHYLQQQGLILVERNYRCRLGELDLIMRDHRHLVFIEVRSRNSRSYGSPVETVTRLKQNRLLRTAAHYLQRHRIDVPCRFDIIAIIRENGTSRLEWFKDAFQASL